jgi:protoporphyrinogen oxidase
MSNVVILGAGIAGFGASYQLNKAGVKPTIYDKRSHYGGHTSSHKFEQGFIFDEGPHISFTKIERIQEIFADSVKQEYETIDAYVDNYWNGHWVKHPAQCNLHGLPTEVNVDIITDFIHAQHNDYGPINHYEDWLKASYGDTFAENFPMKYGEKYHTVPASKMSTDWLGPRLYRPDLKEVIRGSLTNETPFVHYISHFRYPTNGGFVSYLDKFVSMADIETDHEVVEINPKIKEVSFANGKRREYDHLISSIPLPALIPLIVGAPDDVKEAASKLACSICVVVNIGIKRRDISKAHWSYFYDEDICFARVNFPHMLSSNNAAKEFGSIQAEVYFSDKYKPLQKKPDEVIPDVIRDLKKCGLLKEDDEIVFENAMYIPWANIIFDLDRESAVKTVHGYLDDIGIEYAGRYGEWAYIWTDESFISGERAAENCLKEIQSK